MSKNTDKITKALEAKGYVVEEIDWEPIGGAPIMEGPSGGWYVSFALPDDDTEYEECPNSNDFLILEYNIQEVLEEIAKLPTLKVKGEQA